ncbi:hypothetical protein KZZ07_10520 [Mameliella sp. CS4]|uniref:calcium-binding protein n=1 Tax=Mameliella sp. CS4 TaxID=2862329 RepID=UPI001C5FA742|nr:calcium-binding protein [Mameliella sp. CS4]MBW4982975.1 hypothetical protein [Mameliella sp. CS4]
MSFVITTLTTTSQTLSVSGVISGPDAQLIVTDTTGAITGTPGLANLTIDGPVINQSTSGTGRGIDLSSGTVVVNVLPNGSITTVFADAIRIDVTASMKLQNSGILNNQVRLTESDGSADIWVANFGVIQNRDTAVTVQAGTGDAYLVNTGTISSILGRAVNFQSGSSGARTFHNTGTVIGQSDSFSDSSSAATTVRNAGTMIGDVSLGLGDDLYDGNGGIVQGEIQASSGNDTISGGSEADHVFGGANDDQLVGRGGDDILLGESGSDFIIGGDGNDSMDGGTDNDTLTGNDGNDTMAGGSGADLMVGQDGADDMDGGTGEDTMDGGNGNDILEGGADNDILRGRAGEDELAGGLGRDFLTGGQDADTFVFRSTAETVVGADRDQILDFEQGIDLITVAGLSPGVFEFKGTAAFAPSGNPELRLLETATGSTIVQLDNDGDGIADAEIRVANVTGLTADDFVL